MQKNNLGILIAIALFLGGCNFASSRCEYKVDCKNLDVFEFELRESIIKYKITGYLEEDAEVYIQSYEDDYGHNYEVAYLEKGIINYESAFETYAPKGRMIYIPKGEHILKEKEKLFIEIQTVVD